MSLASLSEPCPNRHMTTKASMLKSNGFNILRPWSIPPRATTEIIETLALALGFLLLWACNWMFLPMIRTACTKKSSSVYLYNLQDNLEPIMRVINFSDARNQFKQVIDQVVADCDVAIISRRDAEDAVVMSLDTYNSMMETFHLMKSPANVKHLEKSLAQYRKGQVKPKALVDAK